jgi:hypothetical protein
MERQMPEARINNQPQGPDLADLKIDERARHGPGRRWLSSTSGWSLSRIV